MVARNPLTRGKWTGKTFRATVLNDIWPEVMFFTLVATMVSLVSGKTRHSLSISNQMLTVLGIVLGLVVSFRTSSAYDRYWEGRKLWTSINLASRNIASLIWIHVPTDREDTSTIQEAGEIVEHHPRLEAIIEKKSMINLVQAFSVAVKHMLRGEPGIYYEDLYPLVCFLPRYSTLQPEEQTEADLLPLWDGNPISEMPFKAEMSEKSDEPLRRPTLATITSTEPHEMEEGKADANSTWTNSFSRKNRRKHTFDPESVLPNVLTDRPLAPARNPPKETIYDYLPILLIFKPLLSFIKHIKAKLHPADDNPGLDDCRTAFGRRKNREATDSNVPLEITLFLSSYLAWLLKKGLLQPPIQSALVANIASLHDTMANLDRVRTSPIPFAYQAHLRMSMWLYLFFLPFQIYAQYKYLTIPATAFASFLLLGFLEIGQEIENPFGYDLNDLDLDHFCLIMERELHEITAHPAPDPEAYIYSYWNQPFAPADRRSAKDMLADVDHEYHGPETGVISIRRTLLRSWKEVQAHTIDRHRFKR
ncbi:UPF0187-domain-containing protein [Rickenella mellea]|uniref:UPF0187-domain-containing protein n=1 Tax=Rickenella mellea TaxID=50990 RepID=A0A4Y7PQ42_9AGAM|nr:UPF0187-domain-containing protein [Rickenella mellea]